MTMKHSFRFVSLISDLLTSTQVHDDRISTRMVGGGMFRGVGAQAGQLRFPSFRAS